MSRGIVLVDIWKTHSCIPMQVVSFKKRVTNKTFLGELANHGVLK